MLSQRFAKSVLPEYLQFATLILCPLLYLDYNSCNYREVILLQEMLKFWFRVGPDDDAISFVRTDILIGMMTDIKGNGQICMDTCINLRLRGKSISYLNIFGLS